MPRLDTIKQAIITGWWFLLSFRKRTWELRDYPICIVAQKTDLDDDFGQAGARFQQPDAYLARVVKWWTLTGGGDTPQNAMRNLTVHFETIRAECQRRGKPLPRPGTTVPIEFASQTQVGAHPDLADDFIRRVLGLDWAWISDESSLWNFHTDGTNDALYDKIKEVYGVDVSDVESGNVAQILDRIAATRF